MRAVVPQTSRNFRVKYPFFSTWLHLASKNQTLVSRPGHHLSIDRVLRSTPRPSSTGHAGEPNCAFWVAGGKKRTSKEQHNCSDNSNNETAPTAPKIPIFPPANRQHYTNPSSRTHPLGWAVREKAGSAERPHSRASAVSERTPVHLT